MIRELTISDIPTVRELLILSKIFTENEITDVISLLNNHFIKKSPSLWLLDETDSLNAIAYCNPEVMTHGTWNLLMLIVHPDKQKQGIGCEIIKHIESKLSMREGRLLLVETSSTDDLNGARIFYKKCAFREVAIIPNFYNEGDDKVIYSKRISTYY